MFIVIPRQEPPHWGRGCALGTWDCEADCSGCADLRDSQMTLPQNQPGATAADVAECVATWSGDQRLAVRFLAWNESDVRAALMKIAPRPGWVADLMAGDAEDET